MKVETKVFLVTQIIKHIDLSETPEGMSSNTYLAGEITKFEELVASTNSTALRLTTDLPGADAETHKHGVRLVRQYYIRGNKVLHRLDAVVIGKHQVEESKYVKQI